VSRLARILAAIDRPLPAELDEGSVRLVLIGPDEESRRIHLSRGGAKIDEGTDADLTVWLSPKALAAILEGGALEGLRVHGKTELLRSLAAALEPPRSLHDPRVR
jgi:hypothetical protein